MAEIHRWWRPLDGENYWLEVTDRDDVGMNLKAPQRNQHGDSFWSYSLVREVQPGDVVFHYHKLSQSIIAMSRATGDIWEDRLVWGARGTSARAAGIIPHTRDGYYAALERYQLLSAPVTLTAIRDKQGELRRGLQTLATAVDRPLYFPFEVSESRPIRPMQGYLFKLPLFFVKLFPQMPFDATQEAPMIVPVRDDGLGDDYRRADEEASVGAFDPMEVDPAVVERGTRGHAVTQNALADYIASVGGVPRSPHATEPNFDLAWELDGKMYVAEVKSVTNRNEERQLRLGLGQVLQYRYLLSRQFAKPVVPVLATERKPPKVWIEVCASLDVCIVWPGEFDRLAG